MSEASLLASSLAAAIGGGSARPPTNTPKVELDAAVVIVFAAALFAFNWGTRMLLLDPLAWKLTPEGKSQKKTVEKFGQSASEALFYGASFVVGLCVVPRQDWIWPSSLWCVATGYASSHVPNVS